MRRTASFTRPACVVPALLLGALCAMSASAAPPAPAQVTVYRCTDASGRVALRDSPCKEGATQEVRNMLRPVDGTPPQSTPAPPIEPVANAPAPQVIVIRPPQPMYRCVRPDGSSYTSDSSEGNPRWVPLWTTGYGPVRRGPSTRVEIGGGQGSVEIDSRAGGRPLPQGGYYGGGTWIRDECQPMPQSEICNVLAARRGEIRTRFFNAQPTERAELTREERTINTRLAQDCDR